MPSGVSSLTHLDCLDVVFDVEKFGPLLVHLARSELNLLSERTDGRGWSVTRSRVVQASHAATNLFNLVDAGPRELVAQGLQALLLIPRELGRFRALLGFAVRLFELGYPVALVLQSFVHGLGV